MLLVSEPLVTIPIEKKPNAPRVIAPKTTPMNEKGFSSALADAIAASPLKKKAIEEMIRVAKPGAKIVIGDETERGAHGYELFLPGFIQSFKGKREPVTPPVDLIPEEMEEIKLDTNVWRGWFYCIEFKKPLARPVARTTKRKQSKT